MQNKYEVIGIVGEGAYGIVYKCRNKENGEFVAIKKFKETEDDIVRKSMLRELKVLKFLKHENIVEFKEAFKKKNNLYLVFEYVEKNLLELLQEHPKGLEPSLIKRVIFQLCLSIRYIHDMNLIHRDIKPENLLIDTNNKLMLCDFGFARQLTKPGSKEQLTDYVATRWYRAPEILLETGSYGPEVDYWAIGCIMGELVDGDPLFPGDNEIDQLGIIQKVLGPLPHSHVEILSKNPRLSKAILTNLVKHETIEKRYMGKFNKVAVNFLKSLLQMDPKLRLKGDAIFQHPYFEGMDIPNFSNNKIDLLKKIDEKSEANLIEKKNVEPKQPEDSTSTTMIKEKHSNEINANTKSQVTPIINNTTNISITNINYDSKDKNKKFLKTTNVFPNNSKQKNQDKSNKTLPGGENYNYTNSKNMLPFNNYQNNFKTFYNENRYNYYIDMKAVNNQKNVISSNNVNNEIRTNKFEDKKQDKYDGQEKKKSKSFNNIKNNTKSHFFNYQSKFKVGDTGGDYEGSSDHKVTPQKNKLSSLDNKYQISNVIMEENYSKVPNKSELITKYLNQKNSNNHAYNNYKPLHNNPGNFQLPNISSKNFFYKK